MVENWNHCMTVPNNASWLALLQCSPFSVVRTTGFVWCTTWLVPGNRFAPLGLNVIYNIHSATRLLSTWPKPYSALTRPPRTFAPLGLQFVGRTLGYFQLYCITSLVFYRSASEETQRRDQQLMNLLSTLSPASRRCRPSNAHTHLPKHLKFVPFLYVMFVYCFSSISFVPPSMF